MDIPLHQDQGCLLRHHIVDDTLNPLLVLIQDLLANAALDRGLDLRVARNIFLDIEPAIALIIVVLVFFFFLLVSSGKR